MKRDPFPQNSEESMLSGDMLQANKGTKADHLDASLASFVLLLAQPTLLQSKVSLVPMVPEELLAMTSIWLSASTAVSANKPVQSTLSSRALTMRTPWSTTKSYFSTNKDFLPTETDGNHSLPGTSSRKSETFDQSIIKHILKFYINYETYHHTIWLRCQAKSHCCQT